MLFEWDLEKSIANKEKHGIDFDTAKILWPDDNRVEIHVSCPVEDRWITIGKIDNKLMDCRLYITRQCDPYHISKKVQVVGSYQHVVPKLTLHPP